MMFTLLFFFFFFFEADVGNYHYGQGHPMKPHRMHMAHSLVINYGLYKHMDVCKPPRASTNDMTKFHSDDYIKFLRHISPDNVAEYSKQAQRCMNPFHLSASPFVSPTHPPIHLFLPVNVGEDCPVFEGLYEFCQISAGGSIGLPFSSPFSHLPISHLFSSLFSLSSLFSSSPPLSSLSLSFSLSFLSLFFFFFFACSWCHQAEPGERRHRCQLGRWSPSCQEVRGLWFLLCQRHCPRHPRAPQVSPTTLILLAAFF